MTCLVHSLSSMKDINPWNQRKNILSLNDRVLYLARKPKTAVRQVSLRKVGSSWKTIPLCMYALYGGCWRIFRRLTHVWILTIMLMSQALIGLAIWHQWVVYCTILTGLLISYPCPKCPISLVSPIIAGTSMPLRCIIQLAPLYSLWDISLAYYIWISTTIMRRLTWWLQ